MSEEHLTLEQDLSSHESGVDQSSTVPDRPQNSRLTIPKTRTHATKGPYDLHTKIEVDVSSENILDSQPDTSNLEDNIEAVVNPATDKELSSDSEDYSDTSSKIGSSTELEQWQEEILDAMEDAGEDYGDNEDQLPLIAPEEAAEIRRDLWKLGLTKFLDKYTLSEDTRHSMVQLIAALGFPLPRSIIDKYDKNGVRWLPFLHLALRQVLSRHQRLPYPRTMSDLVQVLEKSTNIIVLTGAGISTSLGIPDFRSESGLYKSLEHLGLSDPQEVFDIQLFREDPSIFYSVANKILPETSRVSPTHAFIKLLQDKGKLLRNYTQNIDNLEELAGIDSDKLVQCHGSFASASCLTCDYKTPGSTIVEDIKNSCVPKCPVCTGASKKRKRKEGKWNANEDDQDDPQDLPYNGVLKPGITFFGEALPPRFEDLLLGGDAEACDLLICIGTSLKVAPVSEVIRIVPPSVPQIYISKTRVFHNEFDITFLGNCDEVVDTLCRQAGWSLEHEMIRGPYTGEVSYDEESATYTFVDKQPLSTVVADTV